MSDSHFQSLDEKDLQGISENPLEGLIQLIGLLEKKYGKGKGSYSSYDEKIVYEYLNAYITARPESLPKGVMVPRSVANIDSLKDELTHHLETKKIEDQVALVRERARFAFSKQLPSRQIRLNDEYREKIRGFIDQIRRVLDEADLPSSRKQEIISKINKFSEEIEKEYSSLDRLGELWISATRSVGEGAKNLEPVVRLIERVRKVFNVAQDEGEQRLLSDGTAKRELPSPADAEVDP